MPGRTFDSYRYRYGFNGKEKDDNLGGQTSYDYGFRIYNPSVGRFLSVDPLTSSYPWYTPYQFAGNDVIRNIDVDGLEPYDVINPDGGTDKSSVPEESVPTVTAQAPNGGASVARESTSLTGLNQNSFGRVQNNLSSNPTDNWRFTYTNRSSGSQRTVYQSTPSFFEDASSGRSGLANRILRGEFGEGNAIAFFQYDILRAQGRFYDQFGGLLSLGTPLYEGMPFLLGRYSTLFSSASFFRSYGTIYRVQGKPFFIADEFGDVHLNSALVKSKGATVYVFTKQSHAVSYLAKKRLKAINGASGLEYGIFQFKVRRSIIREIYKNASEQGLGVKWISRADAHIYGNKSAFGLHTNFIRERLLPNAKSGSASNWINPR